MNDALSYGEDLTMSLRSFKCDVLLFALLFFAPVNTATAQDDTNNVFARVNDHVVPLDLLIFLSGSRQERSDDSAANLANRAAYDLLVTEVFAQQAQKLGLHQQRDFLAEIEMARKTLLAQLYVQHFLKQTEINEEELKTRYARLAEKRLYRFRVLELQEQSEAEHLLNTLQRQSYDDAYLAELGFREGPWLTQQDLPAELDSALDELEPSAFFAKPIPMDEGWQLVQLVGTQTFPKPAFNAHYQILESELRKERLDQHITRTLQSAHIEIVNDLGAGVEHALAH